MPFHRSGNINKKRISKKDDAVGCISLYYLFTHFFITYLLAYIIVILHILFRIGVEIYE
jgi:hypothetical protein